MKIQTVKPFTPLKLHIIAEDGRQGIFDLTPYLKYEVFVPLQNPQTFAQITNGGYFIEWECGADLSADTIEAH
jgi:hypothetical protein